MRQASVVDSRLIGRAGIGPTDRAGHRGVSGLAVLGKDDSASWWTGSHRRRSRPAPADDQPGKRSGELLAAEALTAEGGALRWRPDRGAPQSSCGIAALSRRSTARHFRPADRWRVGRSASWLCSRTIRPEPPLGPAIMMRSVASVNSVGHVGPPNLVYPLRVADSPSRVLLQTRARRFRDVSRETIGE